MWTEAAWQAYARALFEARAIRLPLTIRVDYARFGRARLAFALRHDILGACMDASRAAGWQVVSCRDVLSAALQMNLPSMRERDFRFALLQPGVVTCLFRRDGEWTDVVSLPYRAGQRIEDLIGAAALMSGQPPTKLNYAAALDVTGSSDAGEGVVWLGPSLAGAFA
ncbi:hypothetical protein BOC49_21765 (plasmid) [Burkholderia pseudomallei]|nr:hypothetical protein BOC49_21765 [Burkholderia pseudomallei]